MTIDAAVTWPGVNRRQRQARKRKDAAPARSADVQPLAAALDRPVATFVVDGEEYIITAGEVMAVRERLVRPYSEETIRELALAHKMAERHQSMPPIERERRFWENAEAIRAEAIAQETAIDDPSEAVADD
jgi:hypothetical protein